MSKLSFRARALDASKPMPIYLAEELPDLPDYSAINRAVPQMPSGMEKEEESEHHLQRAISGTGLIIPTPEVSQVCDIEFYEKCYPPDYKMPKQHIHMQPLWEEQEAPEYDMDSDDERWLRQQRIPELTELKFEQMMDKLEKSSGQTVVTLNEAELLLERKDDLVIAVYDYWLNKRLTTQHPLILSVRTESRPGQSSNNPYLAFRRRTEKMQTRKNRKNDESSYEKMLKLRRDLARALSILELVARRERAKRELVKLTALLADRRYTAGDFANQLLPDPPPRPAFTVPLNAYRQEKFSVPHYAPRPQAAPVDAPRQREKRPYKRRKHRHAPAGSAQGLRDSGVYTSSEEESPRAEPASPPDDGPFAFRRKPGCYYEMPTSTLYGDPVDPDCPSKDGLFQHELDPRHRYTLTSIRSPYPQCVGFARRRVGRGGRVLLDRTRTPLDDLWRTLPFPAPAHHTQDEIENKRHRTPKEITTDYHTSGKYPWRHAFRRHLSRKPDLWLATDTKPELKPKIKMEVDSELPDVLQSEKCKSDISGRTMEGRKRSYSDCSDSSYDSDQSLLPVEQEFEKFIDEVNMNWLHFRPRSPVPSPRPPPAPVTGGAPLAAHSSLAVELGDFTTAEFSLASLYPDLGGDMELDMSDDLLPDLTDVGSAAMADPFLFHGRSVGAGTDSGRTQSKLDSFGSSRVRVTAGDPEPIYCEALEPTPTPTPTPTKPPPLKKVEPRPPPLVEAAPAPPPAPAPAPAAPAPAPAPKEEVNDLHITPYQLNSHQVTQVRVGQGQQGLRKKEDTIEEVQLAHGVQLKTVQTKHSPLKKHIITSGAPRVRSEPVAVCSAPHQLLAPVSDALKVRLQNHLLSSQGGVLMQNGPFPQVVSLPVQSRESVGSVTSIAHVSASSSSPRRPAPLLQLAPAQRAPAPAPLVVAHAHLQPNKLKVLHAHPAAHQRTTQYVTTQTRGITQLPAVVSLATLTDPKSSLFKASQGSVAQLFEIKSGQLGKGPHLVNVVRQPPPGKTTIARLDLNDKKRQLVFDGTLKGQVATGARPARVALSLDARQLVRAPLPAVRAPHKHQIHLKSRATLQGLGAPLAGTTTALPGTVVANLLHKNAHLAKGGQKISISSAPGSALSANVQAIAFNAQLRARAPRLLPPRAPPPEIVDVTSTPVPSASQPSHSQEDTEDGDTNGTVRRRTGDTLPMEVT